MNAIPLSVLVLFESARIKYVISPFKRMKTLPTIVRIHKVIKEEEPCLFSSSSIILLFIKLRRF